MSLHENIEAIESGYEYLLAYAAQGRESDEGSEVRDTLTSMASAASSIAESLANDDGGFSHVVVDDAGKAGAESSCTSSCATTPPRSVSKSAVSPIETEGKDASTRRSSSDSTESLVSRSLFRVLAPRASKLQTRLFNDLRRFLDMILVLTPT